MNPTSTRRTVAAGTIGNLLEWYDFAIYGYFAATIGRVFFPAESPVAQVLAAFGIFALGYLMRPLGGIVVGHIGDRLGRRAALTFSIAAMALPTFLVGLLPGYETLGMAAPILLTLLRMIQGLSVGGEATTSMIFLVEQAPPGRRGLVGSFCSLAAIGGFLLGSGIGAAQGQARDAVTGTAHHGLVRTREARTRRHQRQFTATAVGNAPGATGEPPPEGRKVLVEEAPPKSGHGSPLIETLRHHGGAVMRVAGITVFNAVGFYLMFLYVVTWLQTVDGIAPARALEINTLSMVFLLPVMLLSGWLSDRLGRRPLMFAAMVLGFVGALPLLWLMHHPDPRLALVGQLALGVPAGMGLGIIPSLLTEAVPGRVRCTAISLGYNIAFGVIGGLTPLTAAWLIARTEMDLSPAWLFMGAAAISIATLLTFRETSRDATLPP